MWESCCSYDFIFISSRPHPPKLKLISLCMINIFTLEPLTIFYIMCQNRHLLPTTLLLVPVLLILPAMKTLVMLFQTHKLMKDFQSCGIEKGSGECRNVDSDYKKTQQYVTETKHVFCTMIVFPTENALFWKRN